MKNRYAFMALLSLLVCQLTFAQDTETYHRRSGGHSNNNIVNPGEQSSTGNSGTGGNMNVIYQRCDWTINPADASKNISGTVTTYFLTTTTNVNSITFDLNKSSFNNASLVVRYHGTVCATSFPTTGNVDILTITLPVTLSASGTKDSVSIAYSGTPPGVNSQEEGYQRGESPAGSGNFYVYTLSESYEDRDWWPCKADMQDKIDSSDFNLTVPSAYWAAAPGILVDSAITGSTRTFKYKHRYPITSYLVAIGVAKYTVSHRGAVNISGKNVPVVYYTYPNYTGGYTVMDKSKQMLVEFSNKFGPYPFANEKHGYYQFAWGGGMEHQTFSAMSAGSMTSWSVVAHELGHQWFGDKVSFATWNHLWLAEGFAKYSEVLAAETVPGLATPSTHLATIKSNARACSTTTVLLSAASIANSNTIWTSANDEAVYKRGAMIVSMLRTMMGDTKFFAGLRAYQNDPLLAYKSATTADLQRNLENQLNGRSLTPFFNAWVNGMGTPDYTVTRYISGNMVQFTLNQTRTTSAPFMPMPVVIKIANSAGTKDTTVVIYHYSTTQVARAGMLEGFSAPGASFTSYRLSFTPATFTFDPENVTMATGTFSTSGTVLATNVSRFVGTKLSNGNSLELALTGSDNIEKVELLSGTNGTDFTTVGLMTGGSAGQNNYRYQYNDNNMAPVVYYRAKIYTANNVQYSDIVKMQRSAKVGVTVSPNPAKDVINISFGNDAREKVAVRLIAADGKVVIESSTTNAFIHFDVSQLAKGVYIAQVVKEGVAGESVKFHVTQ